MDGGNDFVRVEGETRYITGAARMVSLSKTAAGTDTDTYPEKPWMICLGDNLHNLI